MSYYSTHRDEILAKRRTPEYRKRHAEEVRRYRADNPEKARAHTILNDAVKHGRIQRGNCWCGRRGEAHHADYSKPLEVEWLCRIHHEQVHHGAEYIEVPNRVFVTDLLRCCSVCSRPTRRILRGMCATCYMRTWWRKNKCQRA